MKKNIQYIIGSLLVGLFIFTACTDSFESYNTNEAGFDNDKKKEDFNYYGVSLGIVQQGIYFNYDWGSGKNWPFQVMQNLGADMFSGYVHDFNPFNDGHNNSTYNMMDGWNGSFWDYTYGYIMPEVQKSEKINMEENAGFYGITEILKVELMHRVSDLYGPIIYTQFGSKTGSMPDTQEEAYTAFFKDLDTGIAKIKENMTANPEVESFAKFDILMPSGKRTYAEWIKFANSLRLRLAIRIAMVNPGLAKTEAQKALSDDGGLLEANDDIVAVATASGYGNPFGEINKSWSEVYMNANMESVMGGYEDPRLEKYFDKAAGADAESQIIYKGTYKGIRQGTGFNHKNYIGHSRSTVSQTTDPVLMSAAEVWFLRAEAALRSWSAESVQSCYEQGIRASFTQWAAKDVDAYLENTKSPKNYIDAFKVENNCDAVNTTTPKWNANATNEEKLAKIITQKWIACYPEGCEGWAEQRRTGYPKLFPVLVNDSKVIDTAKGPRRLNFSVGIKTANPEQYAALVKALGGNDDCATDLWWDKGVNF
ncbi:SusD/RagB family nutrient-binding outer membrane lipoprotein [uncultured Bacteroides sp.]|uniref:SusD/RagB family nutrient-binding outer membrane lipoprotein n=1 Tax=uncultured Bacteroides sp. TaxID=162156 RepID=UPI002AA81EDB|nr:SusD/RagB family nutrient-binding outer membrane lipoprotein [uncultured Bacteroides sp.]